MLVFHGVGTDWQYRIAFCSECDRIIIEIRERNGVDRWNRIFPLGSSRGPTPTDVPKPIAKSYEEACLVPPLSPKASAALSRRCLQTRHQ